MALNDETYDLISSGIPEEGLDLADPLLKDLRGAKAPHVNRLFSLKKKYSLEEELGGYVVTPKLDGICISFQGNECLTRGDGIHGNLLDFHVDVGTTYQQVVGELVCAKHTPNHRNFVAGKVNKGDFTGLQFIAYHVWPPLHGTYEEDLSSLPCRTVLDVCPDEFNTDGVVYRLNSNTDYYDRGFTSTHPRGSFALKKREDVPTVETAVSSIEWNVSRNGRIVPTILFDPIEIQGAQICRATAHNFEFVINAGIGCGSRILVTRAGGVIPSVIKNLGAFFDSSIDECPSCGGTISIKGCDIICDSNCAEDKKLLHFAKTLKLHGCGPATVKKFSSREELLKEFTPKEGVSLARLIASMGIPLIGENTASKMQDIFDIESLPPKARENYVLWLEEEEYNKEYFQNLLQTSEAREKMTGIVFCLSGKFPVPKSDIVRMWPEISFINSMNKTVQVLVVSDKASTSSKTEYAKKHNIPIITLSEIKNYVVR